MCMSPEGIIWQIEVEKHGDLLTWDVRLQDSCWNRSLSLKKQVVTLVRGKKPEETLVSKEI